MVHIELVTMCDGKVVALCVKVHRSRKSCVCSCNTPRTLDLSKLGGTRLVASPPVSLL